MPDIEQDVRTFLASMASEMPALTQPPALVRRHARRRMAFTATVTSLVLVLGVGAGIAVLANLRDPGSDRLPAGVRGSQLIAYLGGNDRIWVMNTDGTDQRMIGSDDLPAIQPDWSPEGSQLVFVSVEGLWIMNADGSETAPLPPTPGGEPTGPVWSPDGSQIAFVDLHRDQSQVFVMNTDGSDARPITEHASDGLIAWSPDGSEIAYTRESAGGRRANIWAVSLESGDVRQITDDDFGYDPAWSPDGQTIAYFHDSHIWLANADGSGTPTQLTDSPGEENNPKWSTDGEWVSYSAPPSGGNDIWKIHPDGTGATQLTDTPGVEKNAVWQPGTFETPSDPSSSVSTPEPITPARSQVVAQGDVHGSSWSLSLRHDEQGRFALTLDSSGQEYPLDNVRADAPRDLTVQASVIHGEVVVFGAASTEAIRVEVRPEGNAAFDAVLPAMPSDLEADFQVFSAQLPSIANMRGELVVFDPTGAVIATTPFFPNDSSSPRDPQPTVGPDGAFAQGTIEDQAWSLRDTGTGIELIVEGRPVASAPDGSAVEVGTHRFTTPGLPLVLVFGVTTADIPFVASNLDGNANFVHYVLLGRGEGYTAFWSFGGRGTVITAVDGTCQPRRSFDLWTGDELDQPLAVYACES